MSVIRDLFAQRRNPRTAFVLGGGGVLGAIQIGMIKALLERGIVPDLIVGCSVGAINGAGLAADPTLDGADRMWERWAGLGSDDIFVGGRLSGPWQLIRKGDGLYSNAGLRRIVDEWVPFRRFEESGVRFEVVATSLRTQKDVWFSSGPIAEPILASAALPAVFPPVKIGSEWFIDGGVVNNVPVSRAIELGAERIYILHPGNFDRERDLPERPLDVLIQAFSIARGYRFRNELDRAPEGVEVITIPGLDPGPLKYNDLSRTVELMTRAHQIASGFLGTNGVEANPG